MAVLRFDFAGLGASHGDFADTNFSSNVEDLVAAADVSEVRWRESPDAAEQVLPLPEVKTLSGTQMRFGRSLPSRHNTSAPDISFSDFDDAVPR